MLEISRRSAPPAVAVSPTAPSGNSALGSAAPRGQSPAASPPDVRAQIAKAIKSDTESLTSEAEVDSYLAGLKTRAQRSRRVTALEIEPGIEAIRKLAGSIGPERSQEKLSSFTAEMAKLSAEFDGRSMKVVPPTPDER